MTWKEALVPSNPVTQVCTSCGGRGEAHYLTCRKLRLSPGWYDRGRDDES